MAGEMATWGPQSSTDMNVPSPEVGGQRVGAAAEVEGQLVVHGGRVAPRLRVESAAALPLAAAAGAAAGQPEQQHERTLDAQALKAPDCAIAALNSAQEGGGAVSSSDSSSSRNSSSSNMSSSNMSSSSSICT